MLQHFCNHFNEEYILALLQGYSFQTKRNSKNQLKFRIKEIAIIKDDKSRILRR